MHFMNTHSIELWWLPVGAGGCVVKRTSRFWELPCAARDRRRPQPLFHAALELYLADHRYVIEMTPAWGKPSEARGVIGQGPVGLKILGQLRLFDMRSEPGRRGYCRTVTSRWGHLSSSG